MAGKRLAYTVYLDDPDGKHVCLTPDDEVPAWAEKKIGAHAFEDTGPAEKPAGEPAKPQRAARKSG